MIPLFYKSHLKQPLVILVILILTLTQADRTNAQKPYPWKAGAASIVITPEKPLLLAGYPKKFRLSFGIVQDLRADVLVLEDDKGTKIVFLTCDIYDITPDIRSWLEKKLAQKYNLAPESLLINVSAAHNAPFTQTKQLKYYKEISRAQRQNGLNYIRQLKKKIGKGCRASDTEDGACENRLFQRQGWICHESPKTGCQRK